VAQFKGRRAGSTNRSTVYALQSVAHSLNKIPSLLKRWLDGQGDSTPPKKSGKGREPIVGDRNNPTL